METAAVGWQVWAAFLAGVGAMLALDLGVFHRRAHAPSMRESLGWSAFWVAAALAFAGGVWSRMGPEKGLEFLTGYAIEKSLSVDNLFVFLTVFAAFRVPAAQQHRVLFWGVFGALVMRGAFIGAGTVLLERFSWTLYLFGGLLAVTGLKMLLGGAPSEAEGEAPAVRWARRLFPSTEGLHGDRFFVREGGAWRATPLLPALAAVEGADVVFAVDSVPAVFAVTSDPFIVFTSNVFAILGLRSLYFALAGVLDRLEGLKTGLALVLLFVGAKMCLAGVFHVPAAASLAVVAVLLTAPAVWAALRIMREKTSEV
ncbi:TerC family protein [bacterium]|nr:MAG: TerC family protein [bacterium]